jgi:MFS family permease
MPETKKSPIIHFIRDSFIPGIFIISNEYAKLGFLFICFSVGFNNPLYLMLFWGIPQMFGSYFEGKFSDTYGKRTLLFLTLISTLLALSSYALYPSVILLGVSLFTFGLLGNTVPISTAHIGDKHDRESLRKAFALALFFRAFPWSTSNFVFKVFQNLQVFVVIGIALHFISIFLLFFFKDRQNSSKSHQSSFKEDLIKKIQPSTFFIWLTGFFIAQYNYQSISYFVEEREDLLSIIRSFTCFGFGVGLGALFHIFFNKTLLNARKWVYFILFFSFWFYIIKFTTYSWLVNSVVFSYFDKAILGLISGIYVPLIYMMFCEKLRHHKGETCGILELIMSMAEVLAPLGIFYYSYMQYNQIFLIVGILFLCSSLFLRKSNAPLTG